MFATSGAGIVLPNNLIFGLLNQKSHSKMNDFSLGYVSKTYQNYSKLITVPRVAIEALVNRTLNRSSAIATQRLSLMCYMPVLSFQERWGKHTL